MRSTFGLRRAEVPRPSRRSSHPNANVRLETLERVAAALALDVDLNPIPRQPEQGAA